MTMEVELGLVSFRGLDSGLVAGDLPVWCARTGEWLVVEFPGEMAVVDG